MKDYLVQTHDDTNQKTYSKFLHDTGVKIWEDFSEFPSLYLINASLEQIESVQNNKETKTVETANRKAKKFASTDEVGNEVETGDAEPVAGVSAAGKQTLSDTDNWGLGRIDERDKVEPSIYRYDRTGANVDVYIIDSGVTEHSDLTGRVVNLWTGFPIFEDEDGHGTHVASTVAGKRYGVAKNATIYNVKVFDASVSAPISTIVSGCNAALKHHKDKIIKGINRPSVVNMSLGGDGSMLNIVVTEMQKAGMVIAVAAGNESGDLDRNIDVYPAESPNVLTVNSLNDSERASWFNNYGSACDLFAPGESIIAAGYDGPNRWSRMSGTSMATPHVAGVCALALEGQPIYTNKSQVENLYNFILSAATPNRVIFDGSWEGFAARFNNKIAYSFLADNVPVPDPNAPTPTPAPAPAPIVAPQPKEDGGSKTWIIVGVVAAVVVGIIVAVAA